MERSRITNLCEFWSQVRNHVWRAIYLLGVLAFLLPFVTVEGCNSGEVTDYRGFELITQEFTYTGWVFLLPICVGLAFFALSFVRRRRYGQILRGFLKSWRAVFASVAALIVVFGPFFNFLFDTVTPRTGWFVGTTCWSLVWLVSVIGVLIHLRMVSRSQAPAACEHSFGLILLRVMHYLLAYFVLGIIFPLGCYYLISEPILAPSSVLILSASVMLALTLHFAAEGLRVGERWSVVWSVLFSFLLLAGGIVGTVFALRANAVIRLVVVLPATCFVGVVFGGALVTLKGSAPASAFE
jgi:hypothetical protein